MRLVAKHAQVGYQTPGDRPGCRNCSQFVQGRRESSIATSAVTLCLKHGLEITSGGICPDHTFQRHAGESELAFLARQCDLLDAFDRVEYIGQVVPQAGERRA